MRTFLAQPPLPLSPKHQAFCEAYVLDGIGYKSAIAAGYSARSSRLQAHRLLRRKDVRAYVEVLRAELEAEQAELAAHPPVTAEWIADRYRAIASVSPADLWIQEGDSRRQKRPDELSENEREAIASIKIITPRNRNGEVTGELQFQYRLFNRKGALDALARIQGLNKAVVEHEHRHDVGALFSFVAGREATSETTARLRARHGNAGARHVETPKMVKGAGDKC